MIKVLNIVGARPNFMKMAPIIAAMQERRDAITQRLVHTGQHYDETMSASFFRDLGMPAPDVNLEVGSGTHAEQTARVMLAFEPVVVAEKPDWVVVVGDVNSTLACALVASKLGVKVAHVEAGLRSNDWTMPEEVNRVLTDRLSDLLFTPSSDADENLLREGIGPHKIFRVGNVMIDTLYQQVKLTRNSQILNQLELKPSEFAVLTLHRPSNVDNPLTLRRLFSSLDDISQRIRIIFPAHPRTQGRLQEFGINVPPRVSIISPLGYIDFLCLWSNACFVLTDSGGLQEETTALNIPCLTLRENTERPVTLEQGSNILVGTDPERIASEVVSILSRDRKIKQQRTPELWDGKAAKRIVQLICK